MKRLEISLQDTGKSGPFEEGNRDKLLSPLIKEKEAKQNKTKTIVR